MSPGFFRISRYFFRKLYSISVKIRKNQYVWKLYSYVFALRNIVACWKRRRECTNWKEDVGERGGGREVLEVKERVCRK